jgi:hypothetical protein
MIKNFKWLLLVSLTFVACSKNDEGNAVAEVPVTAGTADFSKYVSLGNSLTAGYSDGSLFKKGQEGSYPNILSQQFAKFHTQMTTLEDYYLVGMQIQLSDLVCTSMELDQCL